MTEVHLKIIEVAAAQKPAWTAELWSGFPGSAGSVLLAGGAQNYTRAQLERDGEYQGVVQKLDEASILKKIRTEEMPDLAFPAIGLRLYEFLQATGVAQEWANQRSSIGLRTYLEVPASVSGWPWELLGWQVGPNLIQHGFNNSLHPILRVAAPTQRNLQWTDSTVRILLVSGEEALDAASGLKASEELRLIRKIFHEAELSVLVELCEAPVDSQHLETKINLVRPHILHFIGHGDIDDKTPGAEYALLFRSPPNVAWEWPTSQILQFFSNSYWKPRLVVLNACHTTQYEKSAASVANALMAAGIPAVIGAQAALRVDYAKYFAEEFYGALADKTKTPAERFLDKAMGAARSRLSGRPQFQGLQAPALGAPNLEGERAGRGDS